MAEPSRIDRARDPEQNSMRILIVSDVFPPRSGGSGESSAALARALQARGHEPSVVTLSDEAATGRVEGLEVRRVSRGSKRQAVARLSEAIRESCASGNIDLIHAQHWRSMQASVAAEAGRPLVVTVRDYWPVCQWSTRLAGDTVCPGCSYFRRIRCMARNRPSWWPLAPLLPLAPAVIGSELANRHRLLQAASAVVAVSEYVASTIEPWAREVVTVPNLLDRVGEYSAGFAFSAEIPERFLLFIGKLEPNKAADRVIPIVERSGVGLPLLIAGEGQLVDRLRDQARASSVDVHLLGWVAADTLRQMTAKAEVLLFPSRWQEPLSRVLLEAIGVGGCVLAEPTGGTGDIIEHEVSGVLAKGDEQMAASLARLDNQPELRARLRGGALTKAAAFSASAVVARIESVYRRVLDQDESIARAGSR